MWNDRRRRCRAANTGEWERSGLLLIKERPWVKGQSTLSHPPPPHVGRGMGRGLGGGGWGEEARKPWSPNIIVSSGLNPNDECMMVLEAVSHAVVFQ